MPRVLRNYKHVDYSELLDELSSPQSSSKKPNRRASAKADESAPQVPPERRRRDSLLSNRNMRYIYSVKDRVLHDRECVHVNEILDCDFRMLEKLDPTMHLCMECRRRALIRAAIPVDDAKRISAYVHFFDAIKAPTDDIYTLVVANKAAIFDVAVDSVHIKVRDDNWMLRIEKEKLSLYHNNYVVLDNYERLFSPQYHLQLTVKGSNAHRYAFKVIYNYSWADHVDMLIAQKQGALRARLDGVSNAVRKRRFSFLFKYYAVVDCNGNAEVCCEKQNIKVAIVSCTSIDAPYDLLICRVKRWDDRRFHAAMEQLKERSVIEGQWDYADKCIELLQEKG